MTYIKMVIQYPKRRLVLLQVTFTNRNEQAPFIKKTKCVMIILHQNIINHNNIKYNKRREVQQDTFA